MNNIFLGVLIAGLTALTACTDEGRPAGDSAIPPAAALDTVSTTPASQLTTTTPPQTDTLSAGAAATTAGSATPTSASTGPLNPPHGQPGHSCAIPVGAPLSTVPANTGTPGASTAPQIQNSPVTAPAGGASMMQSAPGASATPSGMSGKPNPPHGQPGHSCAIPVGQTLP